MEKSKEHIRPCLLYQFQLGHLEVDAKRNICNSIGKNAVSQTTAYRWFGRFSKKDYNLEDKSKSGRPVELNLSKLKKLIESDPRTTLRILANTFGCHHSTIEYHLKQLGFHPKLDVWVPHELSIYQLNQRVDICINLLSFKRKFNWLDHLITGDEKWITFSNYTRKHQWLKYKQRPETTPKVESHTKKVLLSVWWDIHGIIYWELLPFNTTLTADIYCTQLEKLKEKITENRLVHDKVYFLHDNARPHISKSTHKKLLEFGWKILSHPPYSPDLSPTDYYLFRSLSNSLRDKNFVEVTSIQKHLTDFFDSKLEKFYGDGIHSLPARWQEVIDNNGAYIKD